MVENMNDIPQQQYYYYLNTSNNSLHKSMTRLLGKSSSLVEITKLQFEELLAEEVIFLDNNTGEIGTNGGKITVYDLEGKPVAQMDAKGNIKGTHIGTSDQNGFTFETGNRPKVLGEKTGDPDEVAKLSDLDTIHSGIQKISSSTLDIGGDQDDTIVNLTPATKTKLGGIKVGDTLTITPEGLLDFILGMASDTKLGGVKVVGGASGIEIDANGVVHVSGSATPFKYMGTWDPVTNTPTLTDGVGVANNFYVATQDGEWRFDHGVEKFKKNDWVIYSVEYNENGTVKAETGTWKCLPVGIYIPVTSVNGKSGGDIVLDNTDIGLGNVKNVDQTNASNIKSGKLGVGVDTTEDVKGGNGSFGNVSASGRISIFRTV